MRVFDFDSYKKFVVARVGAMPGGGRGEYRKMGTKLGMHSSLVSQVFRSDKQLTMEQAVHLCELLGLNEAETEYFLALVEKERAGSVRLTRYLERRLRELKTRAKHLESRLPRSPQFAESDKAIFYSQWYYSAIRLLTSIPAFQNRDAIAAFCQLPPRIVGEALEFLLRTKLCKDEGGILCMGPSRTHVGADSPLAARHHTNWRLKAIERFANLTEDELVFTAPMTIAKADIPFIRTALVELIDVVNARIEKSPSESLACLNIDWFAVQPG